MGELIGPSPKEKHLLARPVVETKSLGVKPLEFGGQGEVLRLKFEGANGFLPLLTFGQPSRDLLFCFPGIGVPSLEIGDKIYSYHLRWLAEDKWPWSVLVLNWPGYGQDYQDYLSSNTNFENISLFSWGEKANIMLSLISWAAGKYQPERIRIVAHSTSAGVALNIHQRLLELNPKVSEILACSPSGIGADGTETRILAQVAKRSPGLFQAILKGQARLPSGLVKMLTTSSYGLPKGLLVEDPWIGKAIEQTDPRVLWQEMAVEAHPRKIGLLNPRVRAVVGERDPMVLAGKLQQILKWQKSDHQVEVIKGAGHLFHREPEAIRQWSKILST